MKPALRYSLYAIAAVGLVSLSWIAFKPSLETPLTPSAAATGSSDGPLYTPMPRAPGASVRQENGKQVIHIVAGRGYTPNDIVAQAGTPTVLEFETASYDCSAALRIPALNIQQFLDQSGVTRIDVPPQSAGSTLTGVCSMGMYSFQIRFS